MHSQGRRLGLLSNGRRVAAYAGCELPEFYVAFEPQSGRSQQDDEFVSGNVDGAAAKRA
jgi:hypothetical protein